MSDVDYRNANYGIPEAEIAAKAEEEAREQRWAEFVDITRKRIRAGTSIPNLVSILAFVMTRGAMTQYDYLVMAFAETEGWDGVLSAIARAMREEAQFRTELVDRR